MERRIQFEGLSAECILVVGSPVSGECTAVHCCRAGQCCMHLGLQGPVVETGRLCGAWHLYPACSDCSQPSSPAVLSVLAPLPVSPGWRQRLLARPLQTRCSLDPRLQRPGPGPLGCCRHWLADTVSD